jgi:hypothetical protein
MEELYRKSVATTWLRISQNIIGTENGAQSYNSNNENQIIHYIE